MRHEESAIQRALCDHLSWRGVPGLVWFAVPNGGWRNAREAGRMKAEGVKAGAPDLLFWHGGRSFALELKAENGRLTDTQQNMLISLRAAGVTASHVHGLDQALAWLEQRGLIK